MKISHRLLPVILIALAASCTKAPKPEIDNIYKGLNEDLPRLETSILEGRRIVVDPGHGGHFAGTRGQDGLEESMVNLGVGLYLWGLLNEAGADVYLTRSAEKDFLGDIDSTVASDLQVRVEMVDSLNPDILVSLHHNAQAGRDPTTNAVETYYKIGDPASRDLAFSVHRHMMRNLGIQTGEVKPGNYYILRNSEVPAILGEASYLTNPKVEENLRISEKQRLEAEAYFLGILEYFSRGTPRIQRAAPSEADTVLTAVPYLSYRVADIGGLGIDPNNIDLWINGAQAVPWLDPAGEQIVYQPPWDMPNGWYDVELRVRNLLGNTSQVDRFGFLLRYPVSQVVFRSFPHGIPSGGGTIHVYARVLDARGLPVADDVVVGVEIFRRETLQGGWEPVEWSTGKIRAELPIRNGAVEFPAVVPEGTAEIRLSVDGHEHVIAASADVTSATRAFSLVDGGTGRPIDRAVIVSAGRPLGTHAHTGLFFVPSEDVLTGDVWIHAAGYKPLSLSASADDTVALDPWFGGVLLGKRIVINPQGGFGPEPGLGPLGLSGAYVNLQVAKYLAEYLEAAGAKPLLARRTEETLGDRDIVMMTNRLRADRYIEIRHDGQQPEPGDSGRVVNAYFFPGSARGQKFASDIQISLAASLGLPHRSPAERVTYPLQQTACPAIIIEPPGLATVEEELRLGEPWYQRQQAFGIFCGVLSHFGATNLASLEVTIQTAPGNKPAAAGDDDGGEISNWLITVANTWSLMSSPGGEVKFEAVPAGTLVVTGVRGKERIGPERTVVEKGARKRLAITLPRKR
jgi:N-acetylmuramoyl-L-alanine amidase